MSPEGILHIPNWSHVSLPVGGRNEWRRSLGWPDDQRVVLHAGNTGHKQGLDNRLQSAPNEVVFLREPMVGPPYEPDGLYGMAKLAGELTL